MTSTVLWMRHGTCDDGFRRPSAHARPGSPLTVAGTVEAELTARELRKHGWQPALIVPSPLRRARQTAAIVADVLATDLAEPLHVFAEWRAPLCVLGRGPDQYPPDYRAWRERRAADSNSSLPGGESLRAFAERARYATTVAYDLAAQHGLTLVVSHRLLIGAVAALHYGYHHPADIFSYAKDFLLAPAHPWAAPRREAT